MLLLNCKRLLHVQRVTFSNVIASNDPEVVLASWKQTSDCVFAAEDALSSCEPGGSAGISLEDDVMSVFIISQIRGVIPLQCHGALDFLHQTQVLRRTRDIYDTAKSKNNIQNLSNKNGLL